MPVPFYSVYQIILVLAARYGDTATLEADLMVHWAAVAFIPMLRGVFIDFAGLMCPHAAAFNILYGLRVAMCVTGNKRGGIGGWETLSCG